MQSRRAKKKEIPRDHILPEHRAEYRQAVDKQWCEFLQREAVSPVSRAEGQEIENTALEGHIVNSRVAYNNNNVVPRTPSNPVPLRRKAQVVAAGHNDADLEKGPTYGPAQCGRTAGGRLQVIA